MEAALAEPLEPLLRQLGELLESQATALRVLQEIRAQPLSTTDDAVFQQLVRYQGEVRRIQAQMQSVTARSDKLKRRAAKLEARKRAALEEERKKVEAERERLRARE